MNNITPIDELLKAASGEIVKLPPFAQGTEFIARMKRPSMMKLIKNGKIPNSLMRAANTLFNNKTEEEMELDDSYMKDMLGVMEVLAEASFVEPSYKELVDAGIEFTDEQYMFIFNYTQRGIQDLTSFRNESENN